MNTKKIYYYCRKPIIEQKLREILDIPVFHGDQHGTAIITTAALINALDISKKKILFKPKGNLRKLSSSIPENSSIKINFSEGDKVSHEKFGNGIIVKIEGLNNDTRATVKFSKFGVKNLLLRFAKLNKV